jgi:peptidoglycan hydrolase-like protein with peptidoglycan-binding domain
MTHFTQPALLALLSLVLTVAGVALTAGTASATEPRDLPNLLKCPDMDYGSRGTCVEALQYSLRTVGINVQQDGVYGRQTQGAVKAFQSQVGLPQIGRAGPQTKLKLDRMANAPEPSRSFRGCPQLKPGTFDPCVRRFVREFNIVRGRMPAEGLTNLYDQRMANEVRDYQRRNGLVVDGVVGRQTADLLDMQIGPVKTCNARGGSLSSDGTCPADGANGMGRSAWDCFTEALVGLPKDLVIDHYMDEAEKEGAKEIPGWKILRIFEKINAPAGAVRCVSFG